MSLERRTTGSDSGTSLDRTSTAHDQRSKILAALVVGILVLGSVAIYQEFQISSLSNSISLQSSQLAHPSSGMVISNFTVTKMNATSRPVMFLVFWNNGTAPASSGTLLLGVYGANAITFQSCYDNSQNFFPIFSNESAMITSPLSCGDIGNSVVLTASVNFLTSHGSITKVFSARTTIDRSKFASPSTVILNSIGVRTTIIAEVIQSKTPYVWNLAVTNDSPTPIISVNASATSPYGDIYTQNGECIVLPGSLSSGVFPVSKAKPLPPHASCQIVDTLNPGKHRFTLGESFAIGITVKYYNETTSSANTAATVEPIYILFQ